jgi:hypothetical protein
MGLLARAECQDKTLRESEERTSGFPCTMSCSALLIEAERGGFRFSFFE